MKTKLAFKKEVEKVNNLRGLLKIHNADLIDAYYGDWFFKIGEDRPLTLKEFFELYRLKNIKIDCEILENDSNYDFRIIINDEIEDLILK